MIKLHMETKQEMIDSLNVSNLLIKPDLLCSGTEYRVQCDRWRYIKFDNEGTLYLLEINSNGSTSLGKVLHNELAVNPATVVSVISFLKGINVNKTSDEILINWTTGPSIFVSEEWSDIE